MLYTEDITCNLGRRNNGGNALYEKDQLKLKIFEKIFF